MLPSNFFDLALDIGLEVFVFRDQMAVDVEKENDFAELVYLKIIFFYTWLQKRNRIYSTSLLISMSRVSFTWASNHVGYIYIYIYIYNIYGSVLVNEMPKSARYHIDRANSIVFTSKRLPLQPVSSERNHQVADKFRKVSCLMLRSETWACGRQTMHAFLPFLRLFIKCFFR